VARFTCRWNFIVSRGIEFFTIGQRKDAGGRRARYVVDLDRNQWYRETGRFAFDD